MSETEESTCRFCVLPRQFVREGDGEVFSMNDDGVTYSNDALKRGFGIKGHLVLKHSYEGLRNIPELTAEY
jgi:hypothetical protein